MIEILNTIQIPLSKLVSNNGQIEGIPKNPRFIKDYRYQKLVKSIQDNPEFLGARELIVRFAAWRSGFCALACVSESHFAKPVLCVCVADYEPKNLILKTKQKK